MPAVATLVRYKKIVCWGLAPNTINFASAATLGHRVAIVLPVDLMNKYFTWTRYTGELAPTGRFVPAPAGAKPFEEALVDALCLPYTDADGVANGLNFSSSALDIAGDIKRDSAVSNPGGLTHYGANDFVMAYLMWKCFGASSYDPTDVIYNVDDAFNMLTSEQLSLAIQSSLEAEDALANAAVLPNGKAVINQLPGDNKGSVDAMFRNFLAADPLRYFKDGMQIPGLFETNFTNPVADPSVNGNWCLTVGDKIELPIQLVFRAPVSILSVQDMTQNPSSATPDQPQTVIIPGEVAAFDCATTKAAAVNVISIRLQLTCGQSSDASGATLSTAAPNRAALAIAASSSVVFYTPANYGEQQAIGVVAAGGVAPLSYAMAAPAALSSVAIDSATGLLSFEASATPRVSGKWNVPVTVTDASGASVTRAINIAFDDGTGASSNPVFLSMANAASAPLAGGATVNVSSYGANNSERLTFTNNSDNSGAYVWSISASPIAAGVDLPAGFLFDSSGNQATLAIDCSGTDYSLDQSGNKAGSYPFLVTSVDRNGLVQSMPVTVKITVPAPTAAPTPLVMAHTAGAGGVPAAAVQNGATLNYDASGVDTITLSSPNATSPCAWSVSPALPAGVSFASSGNSATLTVGAGVSSSSHLITCRDRNNVSQVSFLTINHA